MSTLTIIDCRNRLRIPVLGIFLVLFAWFGGMAALALAINPPAVVVFGPERSLLSAVLAADASLLSLGPGFVIVRADRSGFVRQLYAGGAWFVWPIVKTGCFPERRRAKTVRAQQAALRRVAPVE